MLRVAGYTRSWHIILGEKIMKFGLDRSKTNQLVRGLIIGVLVGVIVSTFRLLIEYELKLVTVVYRLMHQNAWLLVPWVAGSVIIALFLGWLVKRNPAIKGSGIPQIEGQLSGDYEESWWPVLWQKFVGGVLAIGSGLFLGREGPSIQLGAAVGQGFAEVRHDEPLARRICIATGSAAGLSAAFNAPIASTMFVLEEVYHNFSPLVWLSAFVSALTSNFVSLNFFGLTPVLHVDYSESLPLAQYGQLIGLGVILGILGRIYQENLLHMDSIYGWLKKIPSEYYPVFPFIIVIFIGWWWPETLGGGNSLIVSFNHVNPSIWIFVGLLLLRFVFSMISYGSGLPGGIFLPILTLGAVIGGLYASIMVSLGLMPGKFVINFIIYAMAGYFAGIGKAPFTAILLITEMVGSLEHLMPLAVVSLVAYVVVDMLNGSPIYASLLDKLLKRDRHLINSTQDVIQTTVFAGSMLDGTQVRDFNWPESCLLYSIQRGERQIIPHGDTEIKAGDTILVSVAPRMRHSAFVRIINAAQKIKIDG